jgi:hypothetical protein
MMSLTMSIRHTRDRRTPLANSGSPMSRTRREQVKSSLLGKVVGKVKLPRLRTVGFAINEGRDPVTAAYDALARLGYRSPEDLRGVFDLPAGPRLVAPSLRIPELSLESLTDEALLAEALILGLCTKTMYDPTRPVVWTRASLSRRLEMFQTGGFYALD